MATKKTEHVIIRNSNLFCSNCGQEQVVPFPIAIPVFTAMGEAFRKMHKNCQKVWVQGNAPQQLSEDRKAQWWLKNGERGLSSNCMFENISGIAIGATNDHPRDPDDFRRCFLLLESVPEWYGKLDKMISVSAVWSNLVDNWDKLTDLLKDQIANKKANGMYELMKSLGC